MFLFLIKKRAETTYIDELDKEFLLPVQNYNIKCMSVGFLVPPNQSIIWRGPMVQKSLVQMLKLVHWGDLDLMILDLPPGTGDIQLTLSQMISLNGIYLILK